MSVAPEFAEFSPAVGTLLTEAQRSERAGQREIARRRYETAVYLLGRSDAGATSMIIRRIARTYIEDGSFDVALDCLDAALGIAESQDDLAGIAHATNWIANAELLRGDLDSAERHYAMAEAHADIVNDNDLKAMIAQNRGIVAAMRGNYTAALNHYSECLVRYRTSSLKNQIAPLLQNMAMSYTQLDRLDEAQAAYDEAIAHCHATNDVSTRLLAMSNSAGLWIARGDVDRAEQLCRAVQREAAQVGDHRPVAEASKHLGVIARMRGEYQESEWQLAAAYDGAMHREDLLLAAETSREQAELFLAMDRSRETLKALSVAHRLFTKLRNQRDLTDLRRKVERLEHQFYDIVTRWAQTIESKDVYTLGHCERVADYACALARDVGFDDITMFWFRIGALLHDVGKIVVPSEILNKAGRFTPEERAIMEQHAAAGSDLLRDIEFPWDILPMVRGHHERWDGNGYPDRLAGDAIDISARITCIADVFDALTTDRPYRPGFTRDEALAMMALESGTHFDPELYPRFERLMRSAEAAIALPDRGSSGAPRLSTAAPSSAA